jgi:hypothetical protein
MHEDMKAPERTHDDTHDTAEGRGQHQHSDTPAHADIVGTLLALALATLANFISRRNAECARSTHSLIRQARHSKSHFRLPGAPFLSLLDPVVESRPPSTLYRYSPPELLHSPGDQEQDLTGRTRFRSESPHAYAPHFFCFFLCTRGERPLLDDGSLEAANGPEPGPMSCGLGRGWEPRPWLPESILSPCAAFTSNTIKSPRHIL